MCRRLQPESCFQTSFFDSHFLYLLTHVLLILTPAHANKIFCAQVFVLPLKRGLLLIMTCSLCNPGVPKPLLTRNQNAVMALSNSFCLASMCQGNTSGVPLSTWRKPLPSLVQQLKLPTSSGFISKKKLSVSPAPTSRQGLGPVYVHEGGDSFLAIQLPGILLFCGKSCLCPRFRHSVAIIVNTAQAPV